MTEYGKKRGRGRPTNYTIEAAEEICERLSEGEPLAQICRDEHMPALRTVSDWKAKHEDFALKFQEARDDGFDAIAVRARQTARGLGAHHGGDSTNDVQRDKLIIETDLKLLAKWCRGRYGDHVTLAGDSEAPLSGLSDTELDARIAEKMAKLGQSR